MQKIFQEIHWIKAKFLLSYILCNLWFKGLLWLPEFENDEIRLQIVLLLLSGYFLLNTFTLNLHVRGNVYSLLATHSFACFWPIWRGTQYNIWHLNVIYTYCFPWEKGKGRKEEKEEGEDRKSERKSERNTLKEGELPPLLSIHWDVLLVSSTMVSLKVERSVYSSISMTPAIIGGCANKI